MKMKKSDGEKLSFVFNVLIYVVTLASLSTFLSMGINFFLLLNGSGSFWSMTLIKIWSVSIMAWIMMPYIFAEYLSYLQKISLKGRKKK